jgi:hypothetical protein
MISKMTNDYINLVGARVTSIPILVPHVKLRKTRLVFIVLCDSKERMCIVYGRTALRLCHHIHVGRAINVYGKEQAGHRRINVWVHTIELAGAVSQEATFTVVKPKIWSYLSKVPGVSHLLPEAMKM